MKAMVTRATLGFGVAIWALASAPTLAEDFKLSDVKAGLEGIAVTAGVGNVLERFQVKVLETLRDGALPLVLVRASGAFLDATGGVGQGFSGSPVYIGDKLLGAISGGFPNGDGRLVLVTPIEFMRRALPTAATLLEVLPRNLARLCLAGQGCAEPLSTLLTVSGLSPRAVTALQTGLKTRGLPFSVAPLQSAQGSAPGSPSRVFAYRLEPGAPIAAQLVTGDVNIGAVGAVTSVEGRSVLAFGHPVFGDSRVRSLMQGAYILGFVPSRTVPFKLAESLGAPLGTFISDRPYGLGGTTGTPATLPLEVSLKRGASTLVTKVNLAAVPDIAATLALVTTLGALDNALEGNTPGSAKLTWRLEFTDRAPVTYGDRLADADDIAMPVSRRAALLLALITENPYAAVNLKKLSLSLEVAPYSVLRIIKAESEKKSLKAGDSTTLNLRLQPYRGVSMQRRVSFKIPSDAPVGTLRLRVRGLATPRPRNDASLQDNPDPWDGVLTFEELLERMRSRLGGDYAVVETVGDDPVVIGIENCDDVVTGWAYIDVQVVK